MYKVAIDTSCLTSENRFRGIGSYTKNLIENFVLLKKPDIIVEPINFKKTSYYFLSQNFSLLHYPDFNPFFPSNPLINNTSTVVTVHDLIPIIFPKFFPKGLRGWFKWQSQKRFLKKADLILTDSESSRKDIAKIIKISKEKVKRVYLAPEKIYKKLPKNHKLLINISKKYHLPKNYVLYVGDLNWNKNLPGLVEAFKVIKEDIKDFKLVLVGKAFFKNNLKELKQLKTKINRLKLEKEVLFQNFLPREDLLGLYNLAKIYCQPSFYEGFGLPVAEAMACGCPVVIAQAGSLSEIGKDAAIYIDPDSPESIALGLKKAISLSKIELKKIIDKGLKRVKNFSWQKTAKETLEAYREVFANAR